MKKILLMLSIFVFTANLVFSADSLKNIVDTTRELYSSGAGLTWASVRDAGTSPITYSGPMLDLNFGYMREFGKYRIDARFDFLLGIYIKPTKGQTYSIYGITGIADLTFYWKYRTLRNNKLRFYIGGAVKDYTAVRINNDFMNAAYGFDESLGINFSYLFEWDFMRQYKEKTIFKTRKIVRKESHYTLSAKLGTSLFAMQYRPGYAYINNSTSYQEGLLQNYKWNGKIFGFWDTDVSISKKYKNGNQFKISYVWNFFSTANTGMYRLDAASHILLFTMLFNVK